MDFTAAVARRRMVRRYSSEPVDPAALDRILDAARHAPSAGFTQAVELVVVTSRQGRSRIAAAARETEHMAAGRPPWLSAAPVHVVIAVDPDAYSRRYAEPDKAATTPAVDWSVPYWWIDSGAVLMLLLLGAANEHLAAGFLGGHAFEDLESLVGLPPTYAALGVVTIGVAAGEEVVGSARRRRRPRSETEHAEVWGRPRRPLPDQ